MLNHQSFNQNLENIIPPFDDSEPQDRVGGSSQQPVHNVDNSCPGREEDTTRAQKKPKKFSKGPKSNHHKNWKAKASP